MCIIKSIKLALAERILSKFTINVRIHNWITITICKAIIYSFLNEFNRYRIGICKPPPPRIIVPASQVVQPRFLIKHVPSITERVVSSQCCCHRSSLGQLPAPGIVGVPDNFCVAGVENTDNISAASIVVINLRRRSGLCLVSDDSYACLHQPLAAASSVPLQIMDIRVLRAIVVHNGRLVLCVIEEVQNYYLLPILPFIFVYPLCLSDLSSRILLWK